MTQINFSEIPDSLRRPGAYFELNTKGANSALPQNKQSVNLLAQALAGSNFGVPVQIFNTDQAEALFGKKSIAHIVAMKAIVASQDINLFITPIADLGGATAAVRDLTVVASSAKSGYIILKIDNKRFQIVVAEDDSSNDIALKIETALNAYGFLAYNVSVSLGVVSLTAVSKGSIGNSFPIVIDDTNAPGVTVTLSETTPGVGEPDIQSTLDGIAGERFNIIGSTFNDSTNLGYLKTFIISQSNALNKKAGRVHYFNENDSTVSEAITLSSGLNDGRLTGLFFRSSPSAPCSMTAMFCAIDASEEDPATPLNDRFLVNCGVPSDSTQFFNGSELDAMLYGGVAPIVPNVSRSEAVVFRWITTYTLNDGGSPDPTLLDGTTLKTLDFVRDAIQQRVDSQFRNKKKTQRVLDDLRTAIIDVLYRLEDAEIVENVDEYVDSVLVLPDENDSTRANCKIPTDIVEGLHIIAGSIDLVV